MCGRLACTLSKDDIISACQFKNKKGGEWTKPRWVHKENDYKPFYNGPPTTNIAVLISKGHFSYCETEVCIATMKWGLVPSHVPEQGLKTLHTHNARYETILKSPLYKPCLDKGRRCIILTEGYYEWQTTPGEYNKQPYFFYKENKPDDEDYSWKGKPLVKLAGIFNKTHIDGETRYSCSIITRESDESMSWLHHRMPIILNTDEEVDNWLNYELVPQNFAIKALMEIESHKNPALAVKYYPVKTLVNKSTFNDKQCMEKITLKRKNTTLTDWLVPKKKKEN